MNLFEMYKKSALETALNEFGKKYADFCNDHTCTSCPLAPDPHPHTFDWRQQCKASVIDHLAEANKKMDEATAKAVNEYAEKLLCAIKDRKRDLEYHAGRDADYVILNYGDYDLINSNTTVCLSLSRPYFSYTTIYGMRVVRDTSIKRGEFVIGFKTDTHIKEVTE